ncbi:MAG: hypothetical protein PHE01_04295, partial [Methanosarcina sp.]|nr:hypothetical protein [Methanosarcina sp.]
MIRLGIFFGGRSGEHEVSLMSATSVINAVNKDRFQVVPIGITREGKWFFYDGPVEKIEDGSWQGEPEMTVVAGLGSLKERIDFALPILHGPYGEDGTIQGLFEMLDLPYGGCGVTGSALAMDKILAKTVFAQGNLPQGPYVPVIRDELEQQQEVVLEKIERTLSYPMFVKPANMGSSVGISKVKDSSGIKDALKEAA